MAGTLSSAPQASPFDLHYLTLRSVVSPPDKEAGRNRYCGITTAENLFELGWEENVRSYLGADEDGNKRKSTAVNLAIRQTVERSRELFGMLNTGLVIVARSANVNDEKKTARLRGASIINGAQTAGVLKEFFKAGPDLNGYPPVNFELIVADDDDLIAEISISRNFQNRVADLSIYGRKELFDDLEAALRKRDRTIRLRKSETDYADEYLDTEKLIQAITALMPQGIAVPSAESKATGSPETVYRVYAYRHRARCLKDFARVMEDPKRWPEAHRYFLDIAWDGWELFRRLKREQAFSHLHKVERANESGPKLVAPEGVPDGIVFPMLSALSRFVACEKSNYSLVVPPAFPWDGLFEHVCVLFKNVADHNPNTMGKQADCYIALHGLVNMFVRMSPKLKGQ